MEVILRLENRFHQPRSVIRPALNTPSNEELMQLLARLMKPDSDDGDESQEDGVYFNPFEDTEDSDSERYDWNDDIWTLRRRPSDDAPPGVTDEA